jgi:hypothetical protein
LSLTSILTLVPISAMVGKSFLLAYRRAGAPLCDY